MLKVIFFSTILLFSIKGNYWTLKKDKEGIQVYTREVQGSSFEEFRAIVTIDDTNMEEILNELFNVESYTELFPDCIEAQCIEKYGKYHQIHYTVTKGPWPVDDRDGVYEMKAEIEEEKALVTLRTRPEKLELKKNRIRLRNGVGSWKLEKTDSNSIKVQFQFHGEAGGGVPAWVANTFIVSYPYGTLENLKNRIEVKKN